MLMKSCGSCRWFGKMRSMKGNSGLCELFDARTSTDHGRKCPQHKRIKFDRLKFKNLYRKLF